MIKRIAVLFFLLIGSSLLQKSFAQPIPNSGLENLFGASPDASGGNVSTSIDVDRYTGRLISSFSLYKYQNASTGLQGSIGLSYAGGGIPVDAVASNVGLGWSLNFGGSIRRMINGLPDENPSHGFSSISMPVDTFPNSDGENLRDYAGNAMDGECDQYFFSAGNFSGSFVFGKNGQIVQIPTSNIKIEKLTGTYSPTSATLDSCYNIKFKITLPDGTKYVYDAFDCSCLDFGDSLTFNKYGSSTWYLTKIIAPFNNDSIVFNYVPVIEKFHPGISYCEYIQNIGTSTPYYLSYVQADTILTRTRQMRISSINYPDGTTVSFNYDSFDRLDMINGSAINNIFISNAGSSYGYKFNYFYTSNTGYATQTYQSYAGALPTMNNYDLYYRLLLDNFRLFSGADTLPQYSFTYKLPYLSILRGSPNMVDDWGYFSGIAGSRVADISSDHSSYSVSRTADIGSQSSSIASISLPTGGSVSVDYENHTEVENPISLVKDTSFTGYGYGDVLTSTLPAGYGYTTPTSSTSLEESIVTITPTGAWPAGYTNSDTIIIGVKYWPTDPTSGSGIAKLTNMTLTPSNSLGYVKFDSLDFVLHNPRTFTFNDDGGRSYFLKALHKSASGTELYLTGFNVHWKVYSGPPAMPIGGVRVTRLTRSDGTGQNNSMVTEFKYTEADQITSSGAISGRPSYGFGYTEYFAPASGSSIHPAFPIAIPYNLVGSYVNPSVTSGATIGFSGFSSAAQNSIVFPHGSPVGYDRVEEYHGSSSNFKHKIVYQFTNQFTAPLPVGHIGNSSLPSTNSFPFAPFPNLDFEAGLPTVVSEYSSSGMLLSKVTHSYNISLQSFDNPNFRSIKSGIIKFGDGSVDASNYKYQNYYPITGKVFSTKKTEVSYFADGDSSVSVTNMSYDTTKLIVRSITGTDGKNVPVVTKFYYPFDFTISGPITTLQGLGMIYTPIRTEIWKDTITPYIYRASVSMLQQLADGTVRPQSSFELSLLHPVSYSTWGSFDNTLLLPHPTMFNQTVLSDLYDSKGNILQETVKGRSSSTIWSYGKEFPIANISNAKYQDVAYTSFESLGDYGNWSLSGSYLTTVSGGYTGSYYVTLSPSNILTKTGLDPTRTYNISFWALSTLPQVNTSSGSLSVTASESHKGWTLYKAIFTGATSVSITCGSLGLPTAIDELRLYPLGAFMSTTTYNPLKGISSKCDASNHSIYYEYDEFGQLNVVRDMDGNILSKYDYRLQEAQ